MVEAETGLATCVIYGALPPEMRRLQARLFNERDNEFTVLVASDAVGMGLNLNIRRVIFHTLQKYDGARTILMDPTVIPQELHRGKILAPEKCAIPTCSDTISLLLFGRRSAHSPQYYHKLYFSQDDHVMPQQSIFATPIRAIYSWCRRIAFSNHSLSPTASTYTPDPHSSLFHCRQGERTGACVRLHDQADSRALRAAEQ